MKAQADAAFDGRNYASALEQYEAALKSGGDPRLHYNVAQTLTALERYPEALVAYQTFLAQAPAGTLNAAQQERFFALLDELKTRIARVEVTCPVPGARVLIRDRVVGTTPLSGPIAVNAGPAKIEVLADGFKPVSMQVNLAGGGTQAVDVPLSERIDSKGVLSIGSTVGGTRILVDGVDSGETPSTLRVEHGAHVLLAKAPGYVSEEETVVVETGARKDVRFALRHAPDYTLGYVGFGIGAVGLAAGVATGVLAFTTFNTAKTECDTSAKVCGPAGQPDLQTSKTYGVLSSVSLGVGAAGVALGTFGIVRARLGQGSKRKVEALILPNGLRFQGSF
jgi:hypothetical protein